MKKIIASTLAAVVFSIFSPVAPLAHAGVIENQLTQIISQDVSGDGIQQLLILKEQLEQGNKQGLIEALTKVANQSGQGDAASIAATLSQGNINEVAEAALRQQVEKSITDRIAPYGEQVAILTSLFNN